MTDTAFITLLRQARLGGIVAEQPAFRIVIRVVPQTGEAGEVGAKDVLGQLLAELSSIEAFDPGGEGEVQFILDDIRMNSPVTATMHPVGKNRTEAELRTVNACRAVSRTIETSRRTGRLPLGTTQPQRRALRSLVDARRGRSTEFDTEVKIEAGSRSEKLILPAADKVALRQVFDSERGDPLAVSTPRHQEFGTVDGRLVGVGKYHNRSAFDLDSPVYGSVRCVVPDALIVDLGGEVRLRDVWTNVRVFVTGTLVFAEGGVLDRVVVAAVEPISAPVGIDAVMDASFTGGVSADEYLQRLRENVGG